MASAATRIPLDQLLDDPCLAYRDPLSQWDGAAALRASVQRRGVLQPVWVCPATTAAGAGRQLLVAGFRRRALALELGLKNLPARLLEGDPEQLFVLAVEQHAGQPVNLRERMHAVLIGLRLGWSAGQVARRLLPPLGLEPHPALAQRHAALAALPPQLLDLLVSKGLSLRRCTPFLALDADQARLMARLALALGLGARQLEQVLAWLLEISGRDKLPLDQLVQQLELLSPDHAEGALGRLEQRRFPETTRRRLLLRQRCEDFAAGRVALRFDPNFTRDTLELRATVASAAELTELAELLGSAPQRRLLEEILQLL